MGICRQHDDLKIVFVFRSRFKNYFCKSASGRLINMGARTIRFAREIISPERAGMYSKVNITEYNFNDVVTTSFDLKHIYTLLKLTGLVCY